VPRKGRNTVRKVLTLTRYVEQYQVKQAVVEAPSAATLETLDEEGLWWKCPEIEGEGEVDEQYKPDYTIETEPYKAAWHKHLPFVFLQEPIVSDKMSPPPGFLSGWQPSSTVDGKDRKESERVGSIVGSEPNRCYWNARKVIRSLPIFAAGRITTSPG
jgi:hypothetical protein